MVRFWKSTNQGAEPMPQEILPPLPAVVAPGAEPAPDPAIDPAIDPDHLPPELAFTPAPQRSKRRTGIPAPKQRAVIAHIAAPGAVTQAAKAIGQRGSAPTPLRTLAGPARIAPARGQRGQEVRRGRRGQGV